MPTLDPNHIEWKGFAESMRQEPENDAIRLAFADWVDENQGGQAFAGLIRAMVKVSESDPDNELGCVHWKDRRFPGQTNWQHYADAERFLKSVWPVWSPLNLLHPDTRDMWRFQRGFPSKVVIDWHGLKYLDSLLAIGPVGEVEVVFWTPVTWDIFPNTIQFQWSVASDPWFASRCPEPVFVQERGRIDWPSDRVVRQLGLVGIATTHFLNQVWGKQVGKIWYSNRRNQKVWPTVPGQGVLLPWQEPQSVPNPVE